MKFSTILRRPAACMAIWSAMTGMGAAQENPSAPHYHLLKKVKLGGGESWDQLVLSESGAQLYITLTSHVDVLDTKTDKVVATIAKTPGVHCVALAGNLHRGFTSNSGDNTVTIFDTRTVKEIVRVPVGRRPNALVYEVASNRVFACNANSQDVTAIDALTGKVLATIPLAGRPRSAVTDGAGTVFMTLEDKNEIVVLDARRLVVKKHWALDVGETPTGLAIDKANHRLFATCGNNTLVIVDADTGKVVAAPHIGGGADCNVYDRGMQMAFSANSDDGTVTLIKEEDANTFTVVDTLATERGARTLAVDPKTHYLYLCTAKPLEISATEPGDQPRAYEPGTFVVLVYAP